MVRRVFGQEGRVEHLILGPADGTEDDARPELAGERHVLLAQDLLHQRRLIVGVVDDEAAADPDRLAVGTEDPGRERVERARNNVASALADEADDPLSELRGGPVGEGDREDPPRGDVLDADQVRDPVGQDARLARPRASQDEQRTLGGRHGPGLLRVERPDDLLLPGLDRRGPSDRIGRLRLSGRVLRVGRCVAHPGGLVGDRHRCRRQVGEDGPGCGRRGVVERGVAGPAASVGTHPAIVGRAAHPTLMGTGRRPASGQEAGFTWSAGGAAIETGSSHFEAVRSALIEVASGAVSVAAMPARW